MGLFLVNTQYPAELLAAWVHGDSPFSLPPSDPRVVQWLAELSGMEVERDDGVDQLLHKLAAQFRRDSF